MELTFLGGTGEIGSTSLLMETENYKAIFDYGMTPSSPPKYPMEPPAMDYIFLSHAHLDHSGMIPFLTKQYDIPLIMSEMTFHLTQILLRDNVKISELEGYPKMYSKGDIRNMDENMFQGNYGSKFTMRQSMATFHSAGHIPGSLMIEIQLKDGRKMLYTGDLNTIDTRLLMGTRHTNCDILVMETTYAGREHELRQKIELKFQEKILEVIDRGGKVIIPAFAVGRTQELLLILADLDLEVWLDGLGKDVTKLFIREQGFIKDHRKLKRSFDSINKVRTKNQREKALSGEVILTTSGMLDGGPVLRYIKELNENPKNAILLTGYQVEGSNGKMLMDKGQININGEIKKVKPEVEYFDFSAHSGHKELLSFVRGCNPEHLVLYHGENRKILGDELGEDYNTHYPEIGQAIEI
jgi:putative mRNA 3-end processing factor